MRRIALVGIVLTVAGGLVAAQQTQRPPQTPLQAPQAQPPAQAQAPRMPASPPGQVATQVGGTWAMQNGELRYTGGKWIVIDYGRPILRGRKNIFGTPAKATGSKAAPKAAGGAAAKAAGTPAPSYGEKVNDGAPVWRAGANVTTRLRTQVPLVLGGKTLDAGDYSMFVDLDNGKWTLIFSNQTYQQKYDPNNKVDTWGSFNYDPKFDVLRVPMTTKTGTDSIEQFTIQLVNMTDAGGTLQMLWEKTIASVPFKVGQ